MRKPEYTDFPPGSDELWDLLDEVYGSKVRWVWLWPPVLLVCWHLRLGYEVWIRLPGNVPEGVTVSAKETLVVALQLAVIMVLDGYCFYKMSPLKMGWRKAEKGEIDFYARHGFEIENAKKNDLN